MYSEDDLVSAVKAGVLTEDAAKAFRLHVAQIKRAPAVDEEYFRLVTGFNDVFVVIACVLLLMSIGWIGGTLAPWLGAVTFSIAAWALAEFFTRKRRMALPAIALLLAFVGGSFATGLTVTGKWEIASAFAALTAWLHWRRFKVPITVAAGMAVVISCVFFMLLGMPAMKGWANGVLFASGVASFVLALWWDSGDTRRRTGKADVAFWLHLMAAPLLVHPVFAILGLLDGGTTAAQAIGVVALYVVITLISLAINRRALMVSALAYVLYAFNTLLRQHGVIDLSFAITALFIGSALLVLSAFWHPCRTFVVRRLPTPLQERFAPHNDI